MEELSTALQGEHHRTISPVNVHVHYHEFLFPLLCFLATSICSTITLFSPDQPVPREVPGVYIFRHRTPLWTMQVLLVIFRLLLAFSMKELVSLGIIMPVCVLVAVLLDHYNLAQSQMKVRCWLLLYALLLLHTLKECILEPTLVRLAAALCAALVLVLSVVRSLCTFEELHTRRPTAEYTSNLLMYISYSYLNEVLFRTAMRQKSLEEGDVPLLSDYDSSSYVWDQYFLLKDDKSSLAMNIYRVISEPFLAQGLFAFLASVFLFIAPLSLQQILLYLTKSSSATEEKAAAANLPYGMTMSVLLLIFGPALAGICDNINYAQGRHVGVQSRALLQSLLYAKLLRLDANVIVDGAGRVSNLVSTDTNHIVNFLCYSHLSWTMLVQIFICIALLNATIGAASFGGVAVMIFALPIGSFISERLRGYYKILNKAVDERVRVVNEVLMSIRIIKLFAWENQFCANVFDKRKEEVRQLRSCAWTNATLSSLWAVVLPLVAATTFVIQTEVLGRKLTPASGFTALTLFNLLRFPLTNLPSTINSFIRAYIALKRIEDFISLPEVSTSHIHRLDDDPLKVGTVLSVSDASFGYSSSYIEAVDHTVLNLSCLCFAGARGSSTTAYSILQDNVNACDEDTASGPTALEGVIVDGGADYLCVLNNVSCLIKHRSLTVVIGQTGSGKSSLINAFLGECVIKSGRFELVNQSMSYASQSAFIQSGTVKENILFGEPFDAARYARVLWATNLDKDVHMLPVCGEKGANLSGGQQQRISLARAAYRRSGIIILDDPLSAVDSKVAEHIFTHLICDFLSDRTRILVSHQIAMVLPAADSVIYIDRNRTVVQGPPESLDLREFKTNAESINFVEMIEEAQRTLLVKTNKANGQNNKVAVGDDSGKPVDNDSTVQTITTTADIASLPHPMDDATTLIKIESKYEGDIGADIYWYYIEACGGKYVGGAMFSLCCGVCVLELLQNVMLGKWMTFMETNRQGGNSGLGVYLFLTALVISVDITKAFAQASIALHGAKRLHSVMTLRILRAPLSWFETTPVGRILNRFSHDIQTVDSDTMSSLVAFCDCIIGTMQIILVIFFSLPVLVPVLLPVLGLTVYMTWQYLIVSRELKRLEIICKSPVLVLFSETYLGLPTIRAYNAQEAFSKRLHERMDIFNRMHLYLWLTNRWLNFRMCLLGALVSGIVGGAIVFTRINGDLAGLALLYSLAFTDNLTWIARTHADCQMNLNSVQRIKEFSELEQERYEPSDSGSTDQAAAEGLTQSKPQIYDENSALAEPFASWPSQGRIQFDNFSLAYKSGQHLVLQDINLSILEKTKLGIVGRTGAGKSSLIAALFRLVEPAKGRILIDGVDTQLLPLNVLRGRIAIVPQDPVLFQGSVRFNLDPFDKETDDFLLAAIKRVKLESFISTLPGDTLRDKFVSEKGGNFSVGQRQLLCLARAVIKSSRIIVMDEATASVDHETDALIQETIRDQFRDCTVLCVAHRLRTVAFYDRVVVLEQGRVVESGAPADLMRYKESLFRNMCLSSGDFESLEIAANSNYYQ